jgi:hypothetical protein
MNKYELVFDIENSLISDDQKMNLISQDFNLDVVNISIDDFGSR